MKVLILIVVLNSFVSLALGQCTWTEGTATSDGVATLPSTCLNTDYPETSAYAVVTVTAGSASDLQNKIDSASCGTAGTIIKVPANYTYIGGFTLPAKNCTTGKWIIITSDSAKLPSPGTRVGPSNASAMFKIVPPNYHTTPLHSPYPNATGVNYYRLVGMEIDASGVDTSGGDLYDLVILGQVTGLTSSNHPDHIVIDRSYIHGGSSNNIDHAIAAETNNFGLIDSYISNIHAIRNGDTQAFNTSCSSTIKLVNTYLEAAGENVMFGGTTCPYSTVVSDLEIRQNYFKKQLAWCTNDIRNCPTGPNHGSVPGFPVKNLLEFKTGQRVLVEGNVFENTWYGGQQFAWVITPRNGTWVTTNNIVFRYNRLSHAAGIVNVLAKCAGTGGDACPEGETLNTYNVVIHDNILEDIGGLWTSSGNGSTRAIQHAFATTSSPHMHDFKFVHNTITTNTNVNSLLNFAGYIRESEAGFVYQNNIVASGNYGIIGDSTTAGVPTLNYYAPSWTMDHNVLVNWSTTGISGGNTPSGNFTSSSAYTTVGFTNWNSGTGGDYRLCIASNNPTSNCSNSSSYHHTGSDGKDVGANIDAVNLAISGATSGTPHNLSVISVPVGTITVWGGTVLKFIAPGWFSVGVDDDSADAGVDNNNQSGLDVFYDLQSDPKSQYNLAMMNGGLAEKEFWFSLNSNVETKQGPGTVTLLEANNVRARIKFEWPIRNYGAGSNSPVSGALGRNIFTFYRPGKIYDRWSFDNTSGSDITWQSYQYQLFTTWLRFNGESPSQNYNYCADCSENNQATAMVWGFFPNPQVFNGWILHSTESPCGYFTPWRTEPTPACTPGSATLVAGGRIPIYSNFLEVSAEDTSGYNQFRGQPFEGARSSMDITPSPPNNVIPPGTDSWVRHNMLWAGALGITSANAGNYATEYRSPLAPTMAVGTSAGFSYDYGAYEMTAGATGIDATFSGNMYYPAFEIASWGAFIPQTIKINGTTKTLGTDYYADMNGSTLLIQLQGNYTGTNEVVINGINNALTQHKVGSRYTVRHKVQ